MSHVRPWLLVLLLAAVATGVVSEWAARRVATPLPAVHPARCAIARPAPAIGAESGASAITADYERHPTLGWVPTSRSPHYPDTARIPRDGRDWIALFGDASLAGSSDLPGGTLSAQLDAALAAPVVSYAVVGHGIERIVARYSETLSQLDPAPRTTLVGFRVDAVERLAKPAASRARQRSSLLELAHALWTQQPPTAAGPDDASGCLDEPDRLRLHNLLAELSAAAGDRGVELVVSLHSPAVPRPQHAKYLELLRSELDALAVHHIDAWQPDTARGAREQIAFAASQLERRLERAADYTWGTPIGFGKQGGAERYRLSGFHRPEKTHRWTTNRVARLEISPPPSSGGIVATIQFQRAMTLEDDDRELVLRVGRVAVARWPLRRIRTRMRDTFFIDEGIAATRPLEFRFELNSLRTANELGLGRGKTKLGFSIASLTLQPEDTDERGAID